MNIQSLNGANPFLNFNITELNEGQRLFIEVLRLDPSGQGLINIKGNLLNAFLETTAQPGDKFWAVVKKIGDQELILSRDVKTAASTGDVLITRDQGPLQTGRGLSGFSGLSQELAEAFNNAKGLKWNTILGQNIGNSLKQPIQGEQATIHSLESNLNKSQSVSDPVNQSFSNIIGKLLSMIPRWAELNGKNGPAQIRGFLNNLGVGYERKLAEFLLSEDNPPEEELARLKNMMKAQLLLQLNEPENSTISPKLQSLLDKIIGQQLYLSEITNSYVWLSLPLRDNSHLLDAKIALQSDRHKKGLDETHCRIGVYMETLALGKIGVDAYLSGNTLNLRVLSTDPQDIYELIHIFKEEMIARFAYCGLRLTGVDVASWEANSEFRDFVAGEPRQGVDIYA